MTAGLVSQIGRNTSRALTLSAFITNNRFASSADSSRRDASDRAKEFTADVAAVAGAASLFAATALAFLLVAGRPTGVADMLHRSPLFGAFFAPRIALADFKATGETDADSFTSTVRSALYRIAGRDRRRASVDGVTPYGGLGPAISSLGEAAAPFKAVGALVSLMSQVRPRRRFSLSGALREEGTAVTAALEEKGSVKSTAALGAPKPPATGEPVGDLALVLAAWTHFEMRRLGGARLSALTDSAASFAFLEAGLLVEGDGNDSGAKRLYLTARDIDRRNVGAWLALGNLECKEIVTADGVEMFLWALLYAEGLA